MIKWLILIVLVLSGSILAFLYIDLQRMESDPTLLPPIEVTNSVRVFHSYKDDIHRFTGQIKLPHSCFTLETTAVQDHKILNEVKLELRTKDNILDQKFCSQFATRYPFEIIADAPKDITTTLTVDGVNRPIKMIETDWQSPVGTTVIKVN